MGITLVKRICLCLFIIYVVATLDSVVMADDALNVIENAKETYDLQDTVELLEKYTENLDLEDITNSLLKGEGLELTNILDLFVNMFFKEVKLELKTFARLVIILVLFAVIKCLELEKGSMDKNINILMFLVITSVILKNYTESLALFNETIKTLTKIVEIISPLILSLLIATGEIVTSGIVGPIIMFFTSVCGVVASYVVLPLLNITLVFKIISSISDTVNLEKLGSIFGKFAMWTISIVFTVVLGVLGLETSVTTSVDAVTVKTTQAAVSNLIPVVGKFVSDSAELVMGASEVIGKTIGVLGVIVIIFTLALPAIKLFIIGIIYGFLEGLSEALIKENKITKIIGAFSKQYTSLAGIMIGIGSTFVIVLAIAINLFGKAVAS